VANLARDWGGPGRARGLATAATLGQRREALLVANLARDWGRRECARGHVADAAFPG
jgi:hypothetical protein